MSDKDMDDVLREWTQDAPAGQPDRSRVVGYVVGRLGSTRRRRWLRRLFNRKPDEPASIDRTQHQPSPIPATSGRTPTVTGRTQFMLSPAKAITAGALVFAIGGVFLIAQPFDQQGIVPGAEVDEATMEVRDDSSYFTGEMIWEGAPPVAGSEDIIVDGVLQARGVVVEGDAIEVSDPRVTGSLTQAFNANVHMLGEAEIALFRTLVWRIENDAGAWTGPGTTLIHDSMDDNEVAGEHHDISTVVLTGEGDYEGLTAYMIVEWIQEDDSYAVEGAVFPGEAPPYPEVPSAAE